MQNKHYITTKKRPLTKTLRMNKKQKNPIILLSLLLLGGMTLGSCMDDNYDLGDIDGTVAFGSDEGITLPGNNSTKEITLDDLLDIDESESVTTDADGNYQYKQSSTIDDVNDVKVDKIIVTKQSLFDYPVNINIDPGTAYASAPEGYHVSTTYEGVISQKINTFNYAGDQPEEVVSLNTAGISGTVELKVNFDGSLVGQQSDLPKLIPTFDRISIEFPPYLEIETNAPVEGNKIVFTNVSTNQNLLIQARLKNANFNVTPTDDNKLVIENGKIIMLGATEIEASYKTVAFNKGEIDFSKLTINSTTSISDITIESATGRFNPAINITSSSIELNDLPDFLTDDEVVVDLYNPQIIFTANSQLPISGTIAATLTAKMNDGTTLKTINIPQFNVLNNQVNKICIARRNENIPTGLTQEAIIVPELSDIIKDVPDMIELTIDANADKNNEYTINLGTQYALTDIAYDICAPLSFGDQAVIAYNDTIDGWAADLEDVKLSDNAKVDVSLDVTNNVPATLDLEVTPIDVNGNDLSNLLSVTTPKNIGKGANKGLKISITQKNKDALNKLNGLHIKVKAKPVDNTPLNKQSQTIKLDNITATLVGKVVIEDKKD